jgi:hypothetical protein
VNILLILSRNLRNILIECIFRWLLPIGNVVSKDLVVHIEFGVQLLELLLCLNLSLDLFLSIVFKQTVPLFLVLFLKALVLFLCLLVQHQVIVTIIGLLDSMECLIMMLSLNIFVDGLQHFLVNGVVIVVNLVYTLLLVDRRLHVILFYRLVKCIVSFSETA